MDIFAEYIKRYFWIVKLAFTALLAAEMAMLVTRGIDAKIGGTPRLETGEVKVKEGRGYVSIGEYEPILKKNVFNSAFVYVEGMLTGSSKAAKRADDYALIGTIAWNDVYGMAVIHAKLANQVDVYRIGDKVQDEAEVVKIERKRVEVKRGNKVEVLELPEIEAPQSMPLFAANAEEVAEGISKAGEDNFTIDKRVVEDAFSNWGKMMRGARVTPHFEKGQIAGLKIARIKADSLYAKIGLEDGDILHRINGVEFKGPEDAMRLMSEIKDAKNIAVDITRKGQRRSLSYAVR